MPDQEDISCEEGQVWSFPNSKGNFAVTHYELIEFLQSNTWRAERLQEDGSRSGERLILTENFILFSGECVAFKCSTHWPDACPADREDCHS